VVPLRDHLRADEYGAVGRSEPAERVGQAAALLDRVRVEPEPLELRDVGFELALQALCPGADSRQLDGAAGRTGFWGRLRVAAVVTVQDVVAVQDERDVAARTAAGFAAGTAVQGRS
jgi:hypothetical protein